MIAVAQVLLIPVYFMKFLGLLCVVFIIAFFFGEDLEHYYGG